MSVKGKGGGTEFGIGYRIGEHQMMHQQILCHEWCTHVLELGIGLGHIKRYINKMLFVGGMPMYWNWVLDWVISDDASTKYFS